MAQREIFMTEEDHEKLMHLLDGVRQRRFRDLEHVEKLDEELDRATVVTSKEIPPDVVTMNSEVRLQDLDSDDIKVYRLVFPSQARTENSISILAPIGTAMLGYRVGDVIEWRVPKGIRRFKVLNVLYQPEAAGVCGN